MKKAYVLLALILANTLLTQGCSTTAEQTDATATPEIVAPEAQEKVFASDFPTQDRVEYVLNCVAKHGGLSYVNQYACGCKIDKIAEKLSFKEYDAARTFSMLQNTSGEKGAVFRDPKQSKELRTRLKEAEQYAEKSCFVK